MLGHASSDLTLDTDPHDLPTMQKNPTAKIESFLFEGKVRGYIMIMKQVQIDLSSVM
jgi:hypothetical protein